MRELFRKALHTIFGGKKHAIAPKKAAKIFQTIDIGAGSGKYLIRQAKKNPHREYAAIDPRYGNLTYFRPQQMEKTIRELAANRITIGATTWEGFFRTMVKKNFRTKNINLDYPYPRGDRKINFKKLFTEAPKVLVSGGKIFLSSEEEEIIRDATAFAEATGYFKANNLETLERLTPLRWLKKRAKDDKIEYRGVKGGSPIMQSMRTRRKKGEFHKILTDGETFRAVMTFAPNQGR